MWLAILVTLVAATGNNVGKALQKDATRTLPRFSLETQILLQYLRSRQWLTGVAADLSGALLMIAAFALAPVSLVQPVSGVGLVTLAIFSHFYLEERLKWGEWAATAVAAAGTVLLGASTEDTPPGAPRTPPNQARVAVVLLACVAGVGAVSLLRLGTYGQRRKPGPSARASAALFGLQAGCCFGLSAASCRSGFLLASHGSWLAAPLGLLCSVGLSSAGFMLQTVGLKDGNSVVVCTCAAVTSMVSGVVVGIMALGEGLPSSWQLRAVRFLAWILIMLGVAVLATGWAERSGWAGGSPPSPGSSEEAALFPGHPHSVSGDEDTASVGPESGA
eukprot:jgi/Botrbrau1/20994/Bobra.0144s0012.2